MQFHGILAHHFFDQQFQRFLDKSPENSVLSENSADFPRIPKNSRNFLKNQAFSPEFPLFQIQFLESFERLHKEFCLSKKGSRGSKKVQLIPIFF